MNFIDWGGLAANALWILGLTIGLATWSLGYCTAQRTGVAPWDQPAYRLALWSGAVLFSSGLAATGHRWWERAGWGALAVMGIFQLWQLASAWRARKTHVL